MDSIGFPSQGDLLKFFYNATGLIPTKGQDILDICIKPKSLHKNLSRLAEEDGCNFLENFDKYAEELFSSLSSLMVENNLKKILVNPIGDLFNGYLKVILREHTFLNKQQNIENLIERFIVDIARICFPSEIFYKYMLDDTYAVAPDILSWLSNSEKTPLAHAMNWIYDSEGVLYQTFHQLEDVDQTDKDLNNVQNWLSGKVQLPSTSQILSTFYRAFKKHKVSTQLADSYTLFLLIARFLTYCNHMLVSTYDDAFKTRYVDMFIQAYSAVKRDFFILSGEFINKNLDSIDLGEREIFLAGLFMVNDEICEKNLIEMQQKFTVRQLLELWIPKDKPYHSATVKIHRHLGLTAKAEKIMKPLEVNIKNMLHGYKIIKGSEIDYEGWLKQYCKINNDVLCPWLKHWVDAVRLFKKQEYSLALSNMREAFKTIRYTAADQMIVFLESYMIISLLAEDESGWKDFKRAYKWGVFMNNFGDLKPFYILSEETEIKTIFKDKLTVISSFENIRDLKTLARLVFHFQYSAA